MKKLIALALLLSAPLAAADAQKTPTDAKLAQLVGRWSGTSQFTMQGQTKTFQVTTSCERAAISPAVLCSLTAASGEMRLQEMWMFGWDDHAKTYHLFMTNDWGEAYDHSATWTDAAKVAFIHRGTRDGKTLIENYTLGFKGDTMTYAGSLQIGGKMIAEGATTMTRVK